MVQPLQNKPACCLWSKAFSLQSLTCLKNSSFECLVILHLLWLSCSSCSSVWALIPATSHPFGSPRSMIRLTRMEALIIDSPQNPLISFVCNLSCFPVFVYACVFCVCYCLLACVPFFIWMVDKLLLKLFSLSSSVWEKSSSVDCEACAVALCPPVCMLVCLSCSA